MANFNTVKYGEQYILKHYIMFTIIKLLDYLFT